MISEVRALVGLVGWEPVRRIGVTFRRIHFASDGNQRARVPQIVTELVEPGDRALRESAAAERVRRPHNGMWFLASSSIDDVPPRWRCPDCNAVDDESSTCADHGHDRHHEFHPD
jgi:hypothetical protein